MTDPTRATYKGHGKPETLLYFGSGPQPGAGQLARVEPGTHSGYNFVSTETGETIGSLGSAGKFWAAPAPTDEPPAPPYEVRAEDAGRVLDIDQARAGANSEDVARYFASTPRNPLVAIHAAARDGLAARPGLVEPITGARVVDTSAIRLSNGMIIDVAAVVHLTDEQHDTLSRAPKVAEDIPVIAVLAGYGKALAVGVFTCKADAQAWWLNRHNTQRHAMSCVLVPVPAPAAADPVEDVDQVAVVHAFNHDPQAASSAAACGGQGWRGPVDTVTCAPCLAVIGAAESAPQHVCLNILDPSGPCSNTPAAGELCCAACVEAGRDQVERDAEGIALGDRITGRDVTMGDTRTGIVIDVVPPQKWTGQHGNRYQIATTDHPSGVAFVEAPTRVEPAATGPTVERPGLPPVPEPSPRPPYVRPTGTQSSILDAMALAGGLTLPQSTILDAIARARGPLVQPPRDETWRAVEAAGWVEVDRFGSADPTRHRYSLTPFGWQAADVDQAAGGTTTEGAPWAVARRGAWLSVSVAGHGHAAGVPRDGRVAAEAAYDLITGSDDYRRRMPAVLLIFRALLGMPEPATV